MSYPSIWTPEMWARAQEMRAQKFTTAEIGAELRLSAQQIRDRFSNKSHFQTKRGKGERIIAMPQASSSALGERDARAVAAARRTLTQQFCGDPPPGYSELDKRRQGITS